MLRRIVLDPLEHRCVIVEAIGGFLERIRIQLQESEQMFIEAYSLVVVAVEQALAMQARLVDWPREGDVTAEAVVRTPRQQLFAHQRGGLGSGKRRHDGA